MLWLHLKQVLKNSNRFANLHYAGYPPKWTYYNLVRWHEKLKIFATNQKELELRKKTHLKQKQKEKHIFDYFYINKKFHTHIIWLEWNSSLVKYYIDNKLVRLISNTWAEIWEQENSSSQESKYGVCWQPIFSHNAYNSFFI